MAYEDLTPARFKELKPQFENVDDAVVQSYLSMGKMFVGTNWPASVYEQAWAAATCHLMTLDGLGTDSQSQDFLDGTAGYQSIKSAELTLTRFQKRAGSSSYEEWLSQTSCGAFYYQLLRLTQSGPRVAIGAKRGCNSGYAKDWPLGTGGWPSWWWSGQ